MTKMDKRTFLKFAGYSTVASAAALAGCGKSEEAAAPAADSTAAAPAAEPLKLGFIYVGPVGDGGWTFAHDQGRKYIEGKFGDKIKTTFVENVPEGPDAERVIRDLVDQGNKVVYATSFGYMDAIVKVAADHPDVYFEHATGYKTGPNLRVYEARFYEPAYQAGIVAAEISKTGTLGFVGSFPIPEVLRNINAFTLGAQSVNPKIAVKVVWVNSWFDPPKEADAAQALLNGGADVLLQNTDSSAVLQTAQKAGKFAFGWDSDMSAYAPEAHLASCIANWGVYYEKSVNDVLNNTWKTEATKWGTKEGMSDFVKVSDKIGDDAKKRLQEVQDGLKAGTFNIFKGPLLDSTGKEVLAAGQVGDDDWKSKISFFVKGVEGKVPSQN